MCAKVKTEEVDKEDIIISAAQKRFGYYGLCKTTMNEIAADAGMGKASLYYYFTDKIQIFEAVVKKEQNAFVDEIEKIIHSTDDASFMLLEYVKKRNYFFKQFVNLSKLKCDLLFNDKPVISKLFEIFKQKEIELIQQIISLGIGNKYFKEVNASRYASLFITVMLGIRMVYMKQNDSPELINLDYDAIENDMVTTTEMFVNDLKIKSSTI